jgi:hypothetical protein
MVEIVISWLLRVGPAARSVERDILPEGRRVVCWWRILGQVD